MIWQLQTGVEYRPAWFLDGFPKAGLHLLEMMVKPVADVIKNDDLNGGEWLGTFPYNSWVTNQHRPHELFTRQIKRLAPGQYFKGHAGWFQEIDDFMRLAGTAHVFVYRDLRDVAVSHAWHIIHTDGEQFNHPAKFAYLALGDFDDILLACIVGLGAFCGVVERWKAYAGWLASDWTLAVKFEDLLADPQGHAARILEYGIERTLGPYKAHGQNFQVEGTIFDNAVTQMARMAKHPEASPTFRKGQPGEWRETFKPQHRDAFRELGGFDVCKALGYEE